MFHDYGGVLFMMFLTSFLVDMVSFEGLSVNFVDEGSNYIRHFDLLF